MSRRTLVIVLGQLRAYQLTWENFKQNVLGQLDADLAVCVPDDAFFDRANPFYTNARFRWLVPDAPDLSETFDHIRKQLGSSEDWRVLCDVKGSWLGRISQSGQRGAAAILYVLRWFMLHNIRAEGLDRVYHRFVITRSDFYYVCPHPPLECLAADRLWIPDGEDYGGLCDRHLVVSAEDLVASCNLIDDLLHHPRQMRNAMIENHNWNIEQIIAFHFSRNGLISRIERFPYIMFLVRASGDPTAWSIGDYIADVNMVVKYPTEMHEAERFRQLLRSSDDWRSYFVSRYSETLPARIYTSLGTILYVDEGTGELRHGTLRGSPDNVFFVGNNHSGRIVHRSDVSLLGGGSRSDRRNSVSFRPTSATPSSTICEVERIPIASKTIRGGPGSLIDLRTGANLLRAEPDGRLVVDVSRGSGRGQFRLVPDFRQSPVFQQSVSITRKFWNRRRRATRVKSPARPGEQSVNHQISLSAVENSVSGWYRLKIQPPEDVWRRIYVGEPEVQSAIVGRLQTLCKERCYAGYVFVSSNLFVSSERQVEDILLELIPQNAEGLCVDLHQIGLLEYIWKWARHGFFHDPIRFLRYYFYPGSSIVFTTTFPRPPLQAEGERSLSDRKAER